MSVKAIILITGEWRDGYWWRIVNSATGRTIEEYGPYYWSTLGVDTKQVAYKDAEDYARSNDIEIIR